MKEQDIYMSAIKQISAEFASMLRDSNKATEDRHAKYEQDSERRHAKTDEKLDKLIDTLTENTLQLRDTRKDQDHIAKRMERLETNQKEDGKKIREVNEQLILINERQITATATKVKAVNWAMGIISSLLIMSIALWLGLK